MQSPSLHPCNCKYLTQLGFPSAISRSSISASSPTHRFPLSNRSVKVAITKCHKERQNRNRRVSEQEVTVKGKKENVWSIDNEMAERERSKEKTKLLRRKRGRRMAKGKRSGGGRVLVSGYMLMEIEKVLQTQVLFRITLRNFDRPNTYVYIEVKTDNYKFLFVLFPCYVNGAGGRC